MRINTVWNRITTNLSDPDMRAKVLALASGKAIGLILLLTAMRIYVAPALFARHLFPVHIRCVGVQLVFQLFQAR